ncbi:hypothetical protein BSKO_07918 [Bryopsis sp. KO-2023]|nr:hypothetical protein BSKO_07918 [Bryopsis sp. KO-2023]
MVGHGTQFLQETIGDVLAQGCSLVAAVKPTDPVEYLGLWLLQYVRNAQIEGEVLKERGDALRAERYAQDQEAKSRKSIQQRAEARKAALDDLSKSVECGEVTNPVELWERAVALVTEFTQAKASYVATFLDPEGPDAELEEEDAETDDEADRAVPVAKPTDGEAEEQNEAVAESQEPPETEAPPLRFDYSKKFLQYVVGSSTQAFITDGDFELHRPAPPDEDADPETTPEIPVPPTFKILDEQQPSIYVRSCLTEKGLHFLKKFPRVGSYFACALQSQLGEYRALLGCDTLVPPGDGGPLKEEDKDFVWRLSQAIGDLSNKLEARCSQGECGKSELESLKAEIDSIYNPPPKEEPEVEEGEAPPEAAPPAPEAAEAPPAEEVQVDEDVKALQDELVILETDWKGAQKSMEDVVAELEIEVKVLESIRARVSNLTGAAVKSLRSSIAPPKATYKVLKSALHLIGTPVESFSTWKQCWRLISEKVFDDFVKYDATQKRDQEVWKRVRKCYKAVADPKLLEKELPDTFMGVLLIMMIKQIRRVARRTTKKEEAEGVVAEKEQLKTTKEQELEAKKQEKEAQKQAEEKKDEGAEEGAEAEAPQE